jgi:hypothetical protein
LGLISSIYFYVTVHQTIIVFTLIVIKLDY